MFVTDMATATQAKLHNQEKNPEFGPHHTADRPTPFIAFLDSLRGGAVQCPRIKLDFPQFIF